MTGPPVLWHFPISHYNEKARWALDWKGIPHVRRALAMSYVLSPGREHQDAPRLDGASSDTIFDEPG
jgi:hypothetical protein